MWTLVPATARAHLANGTACILGAGPWAHGARGQREHSGVLGLLNPHQRLHLPCLYDQPFGVACALSLFSANVYCCPAGCAAAAMCGGVAVEVEPAPSNGRCLFAVVDITAPPDVVWQALTDYDGLDSFIPGGRQAQACGLACKPTSGVGMAATALMPCRSENALLQSSPRFCVVQNLSWCIED